jgi:hypothetical protein
VQEALFHPVNDTSEAPHGTHARRLREVHEGRRRLQDAVDLARESTAASMAAMGDLSTGVMRGSVAGERPTVVATEQLSLSLARVDPSNLVETGAPLATGGSVSFPSSAAAG